MKLISFDYGLFVLAFSSLGCTSYLIHSSSIGFLLEHCVSMKVITAYEGIVLDELYGTYFHLDV